MPDQRDRVTQFTDEKECFKVSNHARISMSGSGARDYLTAETVKKEASRRQSTGSRLVLAQCRNNRGPRPDKTVPDPPIDCRASHAVKRGRRNRSGNERPAALVGRDTQVIRSNGEQERRERTENARRSLSGSCAGDYLTATTVKEKPRRQTTGTRLRVALGHGVRGPRPPVCAHDPLNDCRASVSHFTSISPLRVRRRSTFRNEDARAASTRNRTREFGGTLRRRSAFQ